MQIFFFCDKETPQSLHAAAIFDIDDNGRFFPRIERDITQYRGTYDNQLSVIFWHKRDGILLVDVLRQVSLCGHPGQYRQA